MPETVRFGYSYIKDGRVGGVSKFLPSFLEIVLASILTIGFMLIGNIKNVGKILGIGEASEQNIGEVISGGISVMLTKIQEIPFSDTLVVFFINFIIALIVVNVISYGIELYKELKGDVADINSPAGINKVFFIRKVLGMLIHRLAISSFGLFWAIIFLLLIIPTGIKFSNSYLRDFGNLHNLGYLLLGFLMILTGTLVTISYLKFIHKVHFYSEN